MYFYFFLISCRTNCKQWVSLLNPNTSTTITTVLTALTSTTTNLKHFLFSQGEANPSTCSGMSKILKVDESESCESDTCDSSICCVPPPQCTKGDGDSADNKKLIPAGGCYCPENSGTLCSASSFCYKPGTTGAAEDQNDEAEFTCQTTAKPSHCDDITCNPGRSRIGFEDDKRPACESNGGTCDEATCCQMSDCTGDQQITTACKCSGQECARKFFCNIYKSKPI